MKIIKNLKERNFFSFSCKLMDSIFNKSIKKETIVSNTLVEVLGKRFKHEIYQGLIASHDINGGIKQHT